MDPDPRGPKTYGSGSVTLLRKGFFQTIYLGYILILQKIFNNFFCISGTGAGARELLYRGVCIADDLYSPSLGMHPLSITIPQNNGSIAVSPPSSPTGKSSFLESYRSRIYCIKFLHKYIADTPYSVSTYHYQND